MEREILLDQSLYCIGLSVNGFIGILLSEFDVICVHYVAYSG